MQTKKVTKWHKYIAMMFGVQEIDTICCIDRGSRSITSVPSEVGIMETFSLRTDRAGGIMSQHGPQGEIEKEFRRTN